MLGEKQCSCKYFDKIKIPCGHAMIAADSLGVIYETFGGSLVQDYDLEGDICWDN